MNDIIKFKDDNLGGIFAFNIMLLTDIQSITEPVNGNIYEPVVMKPNTRAYEIYATPQTIKYDEQEQDNDHGNYYLASLVCFTPKDRSDVRETLRFLKGKKFIVDYTDNNCQRKLIGNLNTPLVIKSNLSTGDKVTSTNGHSLTISGELLEKAPTYFI